MQFTVGVAGHSGYSGAALLQILRDHPCFEPVLLDHRDARGGESDPPGRSALRRVAFQASAVEAAKLDAVLLATSAEVSLEAVPWLLDLGTRVVDLSGAFRLKTEAEYRRWYGAAHSAPSLLESAVYGLPEFNRQQIAGARFVANPGCYPTAANLALRPLVQAGIVDRDCGVVCDAKSGVSGAGRKAALNTSFCEVSGNFSAYSLLHHRHVPEVLATSGLEERDFSFTAQLIPVDRGILETIYFRASSANLARITAIYQQTYDSEPFVRLYPPGRVPDLHAVLHTNFCDIGFVSESSSGRVVVVSAIDNLQKGAAGQAVQNLNLMLGRPETEGLL